jgi:hypothetical protein
MSKYAAMALENDEAGTELVQDGAGLGFNWGAFFLTPLWLLSHGKPLMGTLLIVYNLLSRMFGLMGPGGEVLGLLIGISISAYFGSRGNEIAMAKKKYETVEQLRSAQRPWAIAGAVLTVCIWTLVIVAWLAA